MIIEYHKGKYSMDSRYFNVDGVNFEIIGTEVDRHNICIVTVRNSAKGFTSEVEHQRLCRIILQEQEKTKVEAVVESKNLNYRQTGLGI